MQRYCLIVDLVDDPALIAEYEAWHRDVWPAVLESLRDAGITKMEIYRFGERMTMIIDTTDEFTFERKAAMDAANPTVQKWESLMWKYQQSLPSAKPGVKWVRMEKIFNFESGKL